MYIVSVILQSILMLMFLMAGLGKLSGNKMHKQNFKRWGYSDWFMPVAGIVETVGAAALIIGYWNASWVAVGSIILGLTGVGGIVTHVRAKDSFKDTFMILLLTVIAIALFVIQSFELTI